ncbi:hydrolase [Gordonia phage Spooky]|nr:hydrolase [Gordonia phage Spooky]
MGGTSVWSERVNRAVETDIRDDVRMGTRSRRKSKWSKSWGGAPMWGWAIIGVLLIAVVGWFGYFISNPPASPPRAQVTLPTPMPAERTESDDEPIALVTPTGRPLRALFTGDSLMGGYFATTPERAFKSLVLAKLGPVDTVEAARAGRTLSTVSSITDVPAGLDLAVVELGTNDVGEKTPIPTFTRQYAELLDRIRTSSPNAAVLCLGVWQDAVSATPYDRVIRTQCAMRRGQYIRLSGMFDKAANHGPAGRSTYNGTSDVFHPNDRGHKAIADTLLRNLQPNAAP